MGWIDVSATGYEPRTPMQAWLARRTTTAPNAGVGPRALTQSAATAFFLGRSTIGNDGELTAAFPVPAGVDLGDYVLQLNGYTPGLQVRSVNLALRIVAQRVQPCSFAPGSAVVTPRCEKALRISGASNLAVKANRLAVSITGVAFGQATVQGNRQLARERAEAIGEVLADLGVTAKPVIKVITRRGLAPGFTSAPVPVVISIAGLPATTAVLTVTPPAGFR